MNSIIFCEGRTDAVLIGQFLSKNKGWQYYQRKVKGINIEKEDKHQVLDIYYFDGDYLFIWGVGGRTRFQNPIKKVLELNAIADKQDSFDKIVILVDRDDEESDSSISDEFREFINDITLVNEKWTKIHYRNGFGQEDILNMMLLIIPFEENGALETVMISALEENDEEGLVPKCCKFIDDFQSEKYLIKRRDKLKAKLSTIISVISPDRAVDSLVEIVDSTDWCNTNTVNNTFCKLLEI